MKLAIITSGSPDEKKGVFNAVHQRIKYLMKQSVDIDVYIIRTYETKFIHILRRKKYVTIVKDSSFTYEGVTYKNLWFNFSFSDYLQWQKLNMLGSNYVKFVKKKRSILSGYDLISSHTLEANILTFFTHKKYGVPYVINFHGSDVHSLPQANKAIRKITEKMSKKASMLLFVSNSLMTQFHEMFNLKNGCVLRNGTDNQIFKPLPSEYLKKFKTERNISADINIAFIGALVEIKNVSLLPEIFRKVMNSLPEASFKFYFIGEGNLKPSLISKCKQLKIPAEFTGNVSPSEIPLYLNSFDLVTLPSKNEGLPLIVLECISCNTPIICSNVGGISEILEKDFLVNHGEDFTSRFTKKIIETIRLKKKAPPLPAKYNWENIASEELNYYKQILHQ